MRKIVVYLICCYQRYLSPYKGFRCAYGCLHSGDSCSESIKKVIAEQGVIASIRPAKMQFQACHDAYEQLSLQAERSRKKKRKRKVLDSCDCVPWDCLPINKCELPDLPCDCSFIGFRSKKGE
ncbi:membrane protein insertion efficiency factor YidD [Photobacterium nomapromontoriensis]|uniref:membrane protein insertion efficiency factor YidD n=1 Tax=Photobacterium nomapromontoriensis TaxID=2910237 RepID=UPI003D0D591D